MKKPSGASISAAIAHMEKHAEEKRTLSGEFTPKPGICVVCGDPVRAQIAFPPSDMIGGPPLNAYVDGWECEGCGLLYGRRPEKRATP